MDSTKKTAGFSKEEQAAMRERARELAAEAKIAKNRAAGEKQFLMLLQQCQNQIKF